MRHIHFQERHVRWLIYRRDDKIVGIAMVEAPSFYIRECGLPFRGSERRRIFPRALKSMGLEINAAHVAPSRTDRQTTLTPRAAELKEESRIEPMAVGWARRRFRFEGEH